MIYTGKMAQHEIICGKNAVRELLKAGRRKCYEVFLSAGKGEDRLDEIQELASARGISCSTRSPHEIALLSHVEKHQGVAARVEPFQYAVLEKILFDTSSASPVFLILDSIVDPQNLGSILRTAHQIGVDAVILPKDRSAPIGPATLRTAAGAVEYLPIVQVTNLTSSLKILKEKGFWIYGAEIEGGKSLYEIDFSRDPVAVVLGAEGKGMRRLIREHCDFLMTIPMKGVIDSLNVSVAGAIILAEIARQRSRGKKHA